jgi:predicted PurR-regulated permease PerM
MHFAASFLMPIMMGGFLAVLLTPIYRWFKKRRMPGGLPLLLSIGVLVVVVIFFMMLIGNAFTTLASDLAVYGDQFAEQQAKLEATASNLTLKGLISTLDPIWLIYWFYFSAARELIGRGFDSFDNHVHPQKLLNLKTHRLRDGSFCDAQFQRYGWLDH